MTRVKVSAGRDLVETLERTLERIQDRVVDAWGSFVVDYIDAGWQPYLLSFMFKPLRGYEAAKMQQMARLLEKAYGIFVTRVVRKPRAEGRRGRLPIWLCAPDLPVAKRRADKKICVRDVKLNDGLHYQGILLMPPWSRIDDVQMHFEDLRPTYLAQASLDRVDVEPIVDNHRYVVGYGLKQTLKKRFDVGDIFVLPRAMGELAA